MLKLSDNPHGTPTSGVLLGLILLYKVMISHFSSFHVHEYTHTQTPLSIIGADCRVHLNDP